MTHSIDPLFDHAPCGFLSFHDDRSIELVNQTLLQLLGYTPEELFGKKVDCLLSVGVKIFCHTHFFPLLKLQGKVEEVYFSLRTKQGSDIPMLVNAVYHKNEEKGINHCIFIPIRQRIQYEEEILKAKKKAEIATVAQKNAEIALRQQYEKTLLLQQITNRIRHSLDLKHIFAISSQEIRNFVEADRVGIFKFDVESHYNMGEFVSESVVEGFSSAMQIKVCDHCFGEKYAPYYQFGKIQAVTDINESLQSCHRNVLAQFQVRSNLVIPLLSGENLWGLLCIHQCAYIRQWKDSEIEFIQQIADQLAIAIQQADLFQKVQTELKAKSQIETQLKETNEKLSISNTQLARTTQAKSEFLANMSHEIRTPMNGVIGMVELLSMTNLSEEQRSFLDTIRDSSDALLSIINDILDFSKIESGMLELEMHSFILKDVLKSVCNLFKKQALDKNIKIDFILDAQLPNTFLGDASRLRQILLNLLSNAIKFTEKGEITVTANQRNNRNEQGLELIISIADTGIGITVDRLNKLFQPFTQADVSINRKYGGTGLGLSISKSLVSLMGGKIWIESLGNIGGNPPEDWQFNTCQLRQGTTFYFTLYLQEEEKINPDLPSLLPHKTLPTDIHNSELKILLAEDNKVNQKVVLFMLKKIGYQADIAHNGLEVLEKLKEQFYDIILMDMEMPEIDGITATKMIRQSDQHQPWIIALTANALEKDRQLCVNAGMNDFLSKPLSIQKLKEALKQCPPQ